MTILGTINWVSDVRVHLYQNGFGYIWEIRADFNHKLFLLEYVHIFKIPIYSALEVLSLLNPVNCFITVTIN